MTTASRKFPQPLPDTEWHTFLALSYDRIDEEVAGVLERIPLQPSGEYSVLAERSALVAVAERRTAEAVAFAKRSMTWQWIGEQLGVTAQAAQQRYGKLPAPPDEYDWDSKTKRSITRHTDEGCFAQLRRDRKGWGCKCGAVGKLDW